MGKRRGNGEGNVRKRKDGRYEASLMIGYNPDGSRRRKSQYGKTKREVLDKLHALKQELKQGLDVDANYTFEQAARLWLRNKHKISPATAKNYEHIINTLVPILGEKKIRNIKPIQIENAVLKLVERGCSQSYISKAYVVLNGVFRKAVANGWSTVNAAAMAEKISSDVEPKAKEPFTEAEVRQILAADADDKMLHALKLSVGTGIRGQCFLAMEPARHIKEDGSEILIEQAVKMDPKGGIRIGSTKTKTARTVPVPANVQASARYLREHANGKFIFTSPKNPELPIAPSTYRKYYKETLTKLGLDSSSGPHRLRHTFASIQNKNGVDPVTLSALCGHLRPKTTLEVYTHAMQPALLDAAQKFADAFTEEK